MDRIKVGPYLVSPERIDFVKYDPSNESARIHFAAGHTLALIGPDAHEIAVAFGLAEPKPVEAPAIVAVVDAPAVVEAPAVAEEPKPEA